MFPAVCGRQPSKCILSLYTGRNNCVSTDQETEYQICSRAHGNQSLTVDIRVKRHDDQMCESKVLFEAPISRAEKQSGSKKCTTTEGHLTQTSRRKDDPENNHSSVTKSNALCLHKV